MSTTVTVKANASALVSVASGSWHGTPAAYQELSESTANVAYRMFFTYAQPAATYQYNIIDSCYAYFYSKIVAAYPSGSSASVARVAHVNEPFDISTVTWNTMPSVQEYPAYLDATNAYQWNRTPIISSGFINGVYIKPYSSIGASIATTEASSTYWPYIDIVFSDSKASLKPTGNPNSGYKDPHAAITLSWSNSVTSYGSLAVPTQTSAVVQYKETGTSQTTSINVTTATSTTIAANTWSAGTSYQWRVTVTDSGGTSTSSDWYTISTSASAAYSPVLEHPDGEVVDGSEPITFEWLNRSAGNNTGTDLAFSNDGTSWGDPINFTQGVSTYTAPAGTFTSGTHYWRGRAYNADSSAGSWSDTKTFVVVAAPQPPYYSILANPRPTITWESDEQQAYQVQMGDYDSGVIYGTEKTFLCPEYLPNGERVIRVRVMNEFNMWSDWAGSTVTISNTPGTAPTLTATGGTEATLTWTSVSNATSYLIYRNGAKIAETTDLTYTDRWSNGPTTYFVRAETQTSSTPTFVQGTISATTGANSSSSTRVRVNQYTSVTSPVKVVAGSGIKYSLRHYLTGAVFVEASAWLEGETVFVWENGDTYRFVAAFTDDSAIVPSDITSSNFRVTKMTYNYADSNQVTVNISTDHPMIAGDDGNWIDLRYSTDIVHTVEVASSQYVGLMQYSGTEYPTPEVAIQKERIYHIVVAFKVGESGPFEDLLGKACFLKDQFGNAIYGVISSISKAQNRFYTICSADLIQIEGTP